MSKSDEEKFNKVGYFTEEFKVFAEIILVIWMFIANYFLFEYLFELGDGYFGEIILPIMIALTMTMMEFLAYTVTTKKLKIKITFDSN